MEQFKLHKQHLDLLLPIPVRKVFLYLGQQLGSVGVTEFGLERHLHAIVSSQLYQF